MDSLTTLSTFLVVRELQNGRVLAHPVAAPELVSVGLRETAIDQQRLFLSEYLAEQDASTLARFSLPADTRMESFAVRIERADLSRQLQVPCDVDVYAVVIPDERGEWVELLSPRHTLFVATGENRQQVVAAEVARLVAALDPTPEEFLTLLPPAQGCSLEAVEVELEVVTDPGGGRVASRRARIAQHEARKTAVEVLNSIGEPWHHQRQAIVEDARAGARPRRIMSRERELTQLGRLLEAPSRPSVLLVGEDLSGRQALLEEWLVTRLCAGHEVRLYATSAAQLIAGMSFLGQWQARLTRVMEAAELLDAVLYFDDLADLFGDHAGSHIDLPSSMRRYLEDHRVRVIGRLTPNRLAALEGRNVGFFNAFHRVAVAPLDRAQTVSIIRARATQDESSRVHLAPSCAETLVELVERYQPYRSLPGKAVRFYQELLAGYDRESSGSVELGAGDVQRWMSRQTGIPEQLLRVDQRLELAVVEAKLQAQLVGQEPAVRAVAEAVAVVKANLQPSGRPLANLLFIGPTGVGKTELARALANFLFGSPERLLRFDMSEYRDSHAAERLIRGTDREEGLLTREVRRQPFCVLLFDEIEKAESSVFDLLLGVLGEARLSDAKGRTSYFHNCLIILTSNLGATHKSQALGLVREGAQPNISSASQNNYLQAVREHFRPEFINRLDRVVTFDALSREQIASVLELLLAKAAARRGYLERGVELELSDAARAWLSEVGYSAAYGARALRRELEDRVIAPVAALLSQLGNEASGARIRVRLRSEPSGNSVFRRLELPDLAFDMERRSLKSGARGQLSAYSAIAERAHSARGWLALDPIDELRTRIDYVRAELNQSSANSKKQKAGNTSGVQLDKLRRELGELEGLWQSLELPLADLHGAEELAFDALLAGEAVQPLVEEAAQAEARIRTALTPALLSQTEERDEVVLLVRELDAGRALRDWWLGLPAELAVRGWRLQGHLPSSVAKPSARWYAESYWSDPMEPRELDLRIKDNARRPLEVLLRLSGRCAGALLSLECGVQRIFRTANDTKPAVLEVVRMGGKIELPQATWESKLLRPPETPELQVLAKMRAVRTHRLDKKLLEFMQPIPSAALVPGQYWSRLDELVLPLLLNHLEAGHDLSQLTSPGAEAD